jgi:hypothetical protein
MTIMSIVRAAMVAAFLLPASARAEQQNDLREFHIGMAVSALPESGYGRFVCAGDPSKKLTRWNNYQICRPSRMALARSAFVTAAGMTTAQRRRSAVSRSTSPC